MFQQHQFMRTKLSLVVAAVFAASVAPAAMADDNSTQVQQMQQEIRSLEQRLETLQTQTQQTQAKVDQTTAKVDQTQAKADQTQVKVDQLSGLVPIGDKNGKANVHSVQFGGVNVTLGGFAAEENVYRTSSLQSDINSPFSKIAFAPTTGAAPSNGYYNQPEFRMTDRQSRIDLLAQGDVNPNTVLSAYYEADFLGGAPTANSNESNSYNLRTRHVYSTIDWLNTGWHLLAGQTWSLATMNSQGITPRNEVTPLTIDAQYVPGFVWARQAQIRVTKDWDKQYWAAVSLENAQSPGVGAQLNAIPGGLLNVTGGFSPAYSVNKYPDVIAKVAAETDFGHFELYDLMRNFQSMAGNNGTTGAQQSTWGNSVGAGMIIPVIPKTLDFNLSGLYGQGVGRYGTTGLTDATLDAGNNLQLLTGYSVLGAAIWHADPKLDIYLDIGEDVADGSTYATASGGLTGYGNGVTTVGGFNGCATGATLGAGCGQLNSSVQETIGLWWSAYKGSYGAAKLGLQYSHTTLTDFQLAGNGPTPSTSDNMVMTSLRYYPF